MLADVQPSVDRAEELLVELQREFASASRSIAYSVEPRFDELKEKKLHVLRVDWDPPARWSVVIGEILHDLRSALDHAVTVLTVSESGRELRGTEFPIFVDQSLYSARTATGDEFSRRSGRYKIRGVHAHTKGLIRRVQPFGAKPGAGGEFGSLRVLHDLNVVDKHRKLHLVALGTAASELRWVRDVTFKSFPGMTLHLASAVADGTPLVEWIPSSGYEPISDIEIDFDFAIAFGVDTPWVATQPVERVIKDLINAVKRVLILLDGTVPP